MADNKLNLRLMKEINEVKQRSKSSGEMDINPVSGNLRHLKAMILGPSNSPYAGGTFYLDLSIPETYPDNSPQVKFLTKIWHPNVDYRGGYVCLNILNFDWAPGMTLNYLLISLQTLLATPEAEDALIPAIGDQLARNRQMYVDTAKHWTHVYAGGPQVVLELKNKLEQYKLNSGIDENFLLEWLSSNEWNIE